MSKGFVIRLLENFLCAGSSALLIPIAHLDADLWFISAFALIPFLWRCRQVSLLESVALAGVLAASYDFLTVPVASWATPGAFVFKLLILNLLFAVLAIAANRSAKYIGPKSVFIAVCWLPIEYIMSHYTDLGSIVAFLESDATLLIRIGSLSGILLISLVVVLVNWLIIALLGRVLQALCATRTFASDDRNRLSLFSEEIAFQIGWHYFIDPRAPPRVTLFVAI
jgi:hypothetical protein